MARITHAGATGLRAQACFKKMPRFTSLECMAQLAALHVRYRLDFDRHAFLLKVGRTVWPPEESLTGLYHLTAELDSQSSDTFAYQVKMHSAAGTMLGADLLIGTKPYDNNFKARQLKEHYRQIFKKLQTQN